jgi:hypothetical protein
MADEPQPSDLEKLIAAVGRVQARSMVNNFILLEVVCELARTQGAPQKYISDMFDRVIFRWEHDETPEKAARPVSIETKWTIENFFSVARKRLDREGL